MTNAALRLVLLLMQAPGDGWALVQSQSGEIKTLYWDLFDTTELWVTLYPAQPQPRVRLVFQALFPGREVKGSPKSMAVRAYVWWQPPAENWVVVSDASLRFVVDRHVIDLTGPEGSSSPLMPCGDCLTNGVLATLKPAWLKDIATAAAVEGTALGYPIALSLADRSAIAEFARRAGVLGN